MAGVNLTMRAETTAVLSKAGMLTPDGRCKTLDAAADGYARGEACAVHLLEAATAEELEGGVAARAILILGTAVNQDGRSSSLTAPNGPSQQQAQRDLPCVFMPFARPHRCFVDSLLHWRQGCAALVPQVLLAGRSSEPLSTYRPRMPTMSASSRCMARAPDWATPLRSAPHSQCSGPPPSTCSPLSFR